MYQTLPVLIPLCFFRIHTQDVPYAPVALAGFIVFQLLVSVSSFFQAIPLTAGTIWWIACSIIVQLLSLRLLLGLYLKPTRWVKMSLAVFGSGAIFTVMGLFLLLVPLMIFFLILSVWKFFVNVKIYEETLEVKKWQAMVWVLLVEILTVLPLMVIMPQLPME